MASGFLLSACTSGMHDPRLEPLPEALTVEIRVAPSDSSHPNGEFPVVAPGDDVPLRADTNYGSGVDLRWAVTPNEGRFDDTHNETVTWTAPDAAGTYTVNVTATHGDQTASSTQTIVVRVPLQVHASASSETIGVGADIELTATADGDEGGDAVFQWTVEPSGGSFDSSTGDTVRWTAPSTPGTYTITVTGTSSEQTATDSVTIDVQNVLGVTPSANRTAIAVQQDVALTANITGPGAQDATLSWSVSPKAGDFDTRSSDSVTWTAPNTPDTYTIHVTATSGEATASNTITIDVQPALSVTVSADKTATYVQGKVEFEAQAAGFGAAGVTYSWSVTPTGGSSFDGSGDSVTWTAPSAQGTYTVRVTVSDGTQSASSSQDIDVQPALSVTASTNKTTIAEGEDVQLTATAAGFGASGASLTWAGSPQGGAFSPATGDSVTWTAPSAQGTYTLTVTAAAGDQSADDTLDIVVQPALTVQIDSPPSSMDAITSTGLSATVGGAYANQVNSIQWTSDDGAFSDGTILHPTWTSPRTTGDITLHITVSDGSHQAQDSITITITHPACQTRKPCTLITNVDELQAMQDDVAGHYILANDIDASDTQNWDNGAGFVPVGIFTGVLDGQNHTIKNLTIDTRSNQSNAGLFEWTDGNNPRSVIKNVGLVNVDIQGDGYVGAISGLVERTIIENVFVTGTISGDGTVGGLVGYLKAGGTIRNSYSMADVSGTSKIGGIAGWIVGSTIENVYLTGEVSGSSYTGRFAGEFDHGTISGCYLDSSISTGFPIVGFNPQGATFDAKLKTTQDLYKESTYTGWDFTNIWSIEQGLDYPQLQGLQRP